MNSSIPPVLAVTYASHQNAALEDWCATARQCGFEISVLGIGKPWHGFKDKIQAYEIEAQRVAKQNPNQIMVFCDAYDLLFNAPSSHIDQIMQAHANQGHRVVVGMEECCGGRNCAGLMIPKTTSRYCYVNSGCIVGFANDLMFFFHRANATGKDDDQKAVGQVCREDAGRTIAFDFERRLVANTLANVVAMTTGQCDQLEWHDKGHYFTVNGKRPCVLHFPATHYDAMKRENLIRGHLIGSHRRAQTQEIIHTLWQKNKNYIPLGVIMVGIPIVLALTYKASHQSY